MEYYIILRNTKPGPFFNFFFSFPVITVLEKFKLKSSASGYLYRAEPNIVYYEKYIR